MLQSLISLSISLIIPLSQALAQEQQEQLLTYKDPTFGIEVKYPSLWEKIDFNTSKLEPMNVIVGFTVGKDNLTDEEANVFIVVEDSDNKFSTLKEYARYKYNQIKAEDIINSEILNDTETTVMGGEGWKIDYTYLSKYLEKAIGTKWLRVMGDKGYEIQFGANKYLYDQFIGDVERFKESIQIPSNNISASSIANTR